MIWSCRPLSTAYKTLLFARYRQCSKEPLRHHTHTPAHAHAHAVLTTTQCKSNATPHTHITVSAHTVTHTHTPQGHYIKSPPHTYHHHTAVEVAKRAHLYVCACKCAPVHVAEDQDRLEGFCTTSLTLFLDDGSCMVAVCYHHQERRNILYQLLLTLLRIQDLEQRYSVSGNCRGIMSRKHSCIYTGDGDSE